MNETFKRGQNFDKSFVLMAVEGKKRIKNVTKDIKEISQSLRFS